MTPCAAKIESNDGEGTLDRGSEPSVLRIQTRQSPYMDTLHAHHQVRIKLDSDATDNITRQQYFEGNVQASPHDITTLASCPVTEFLQQCLQGPRYGNPYVFDIYGPT